MNTKYFHGFGRFHTTVFMHNGNKLTFCSGSTVFRSPANMIHSRTEMNTILIIEDDSRLGPTLRKGLTELGFAARLATTGAEALSMLRQRTPDLIVLDIGLPDYDGIELLSQFRGLGLHELVLILTARDELADKLRGLEVGADDYMVKPFAFAELVGRIRALLRRSILAARILRAGDLTLNLVARTVDRGAHSIELPPREFDLLVYLADHVGEIVSRTMLAKHVWHEPSRATSLDNVIDVHISRLRRKLSDELGTDGLKVIRGQGILLEGAP